MALAGGVILPATFARGQFANAVATLYTAPTTNSATGCMAILKEIWLSNTDTSAHTVYLYIVEAGGSVADNRLLIPAVSIPANTFHLIHCRTPIKTALITGTLTGDTIRGYADVANKVTYLLNGVEYT